MGWLFILLFLSFQRFVRAQYDPLGNFCRILDHQSAIVDGKLYIDGGKEIFAAFNGDTGVVIGNRTVGPNNYLIEIDMSGSWDWQTNNFSSRQISKNDSAPSLARGTSFPDPKNPGSFYIFGGTLPQDNLTFQDLHEILPESKSLWTYDTLTDNWISYDMPNIRRPSSGASAFVPELGLGFYYGGLQDNASSTDTEVIGDTTRFLDGMIVLDLNNQTARNFSTKAVSNNARVRGGMVYVPIPGTDGILVLLGGGEKPSTDLTHEWKGTLSSFGIVDIFDLGSLKNESAPDGMWYSQRTSGSLPDTRIDACFVTASAPDNSSYNIYMYGGRDGTGKYYDEVWILSMPSFQWQKVWGGTANRYSMTCHFVGNRQMLTVGGANTSKILDSCDWETKGVAIFDMTSLNWTSTYDAEAAPYEVPSPLYKLIGGTATGGASVVTPLGDFDNPKVAALFNPNQTNSSTNTTTTPPLSSSGDHEDTKSGSNAGAIAGGVVGGVAGVAIIVGGILYWLRRRKNELKKSELNIAEVPGDSHHVAGELSGTHEVFETQGAAVYEKSGDDGLHEMPGDEGEETKKAEPMEPVELAAEDVTRVASKKSSESAHSQPVHRPE